MTEPQKQLAILFADIAGSTRLYEQLGDVAARDIISNLIEGMTRITASFGGTLIKTIGDEIMCRFDSAAAAAAASIALQEAARDQLLGTSHPAQIRCGFHFGPALLENHDVYGDAVNVAARIAAMAKAGQIITSGDAVKDLPKNISRSARQVDATALKGKEEQFEIYEIVWEEHNVTMIMSTPNILVEGNLQTLILEFMGRRLELKPGDSVSIGRSDQCEVMIPSTFASRQHARIEFRRGKFVIADQSTNGTYVMTEAKQVFLKREELPLWASGAITLGDASPTSDNLTIMYRIL